jgi:hypothetical protein
MTPRDVDALSDAEYRALTRYARAELAAVERERKRRR